MIIKGLVLVQRVLVEEEAFAMELVLVPLAVVGWFVLVVVEDTLAVHFVVPEVAQVVGALGVA